MARNSTPGNLARKVFEKIQGARVKHPIPEINILTQLFECLFYASLKTEESEFIKVTVTLISRKNPDPSPPKRIVKNRWNCIRFDSAIDLNVKNIVKLSKAADPWSSSLAIDFDASGKLSIWGMIDQAVHYQGFLHYEVESGPEQPGLFQVSITGIGCLEVIFDYELIATLKQNLLIVNYLDVFSRGPINTILKRFSNAFKKEIDQYLEKEFPKEDIDTYWHNLIFESWIQVISRLLIRIKNYGHGGALLITDKYAEDLDIKHIIEYDRLGTSIQNVMKQKMAHSFYGDKVMDRIDEEKSIPSLFYLKESISMFEKNESNDELRGAIRFVSSLSCIDGLILMDTNLSVKGFGCVIKNIDLPDNIYISKSSRINEEKLTKQNPNTFGTRHRSMFSFCRKNHGSIGFVVSQDGDIRAITTINNKVIMWENIKVQQLQKSKKLKRVISDIGATSKSPTI